MCTLVWSDFYCSSILCAYVRCSYIHNSYFVCTMCTHFVVSLNIKSCLTGTFGTEIRKMQSDDGTPNGLYHGPKNGRVNERIDERTDGRSVSLSGFCIIITYWCKDHYTIMPITLNKLFTGDRFFDLFSLSLSLSVSHLLFELKTTFVDLTKKKLMRERIDVHCWWKLKTLYGMNNMFVLLTSYYI